MAADCGNCGKPRNHFDHSRGICNYVDSSRAGLSPIGRARERFNASQRGRDYSERTRALSDVVVACQIQSPVCTGRAQHQDEAYPRGRAGGLPAALRDGPEPALSCDACNRYLAENLVWAQEHGWGRRKPPPMEEVKTWPKDL